MSKPQSQTNALGELPAFFKHYFLKKYFMITDGAYYSASVSDMEKGNTRYEGAELIGHVISQVADGSIVRCSKEEFDKAWNEAKLLNI